jgi:hypothetical protein
VQLRTKPATKKFHLKPEDKTRMAILDYCRLVYPSLYETVIGIFNEGNRSRSTNKILPRLGLRKGASDLFFALPKNGYHGLWMEIKKDGWKYTSSQREHIENQTKFLEQMISLGYMGRMVVGTDEGIKLLNEYMRP